jgi:cation transport regulator
MASGDWQSYFKGILQSKGLGPLDERSTMPYKQITQLPESVKNNLPKGAQEIYKEAFNSAEEQYGEEDRAHRVAWSAVENKYEKNEKGNWVQKNS